MRGVIVRALIGSLVGVSLACGSADSSTALGLSPETLLPTDLAGYADLYGISLDAARLQMTLEDGVPGLGATLKEALGPDFSGLWLRHAPAFSVHVSGVGNHAADVAAVIAGTPYADLTTFESAGLTFVELDTLARTSAEWVTVPHDLEIDIVHNQVVVHLAEKDRGRVDLGGRRGVSLLYGPNLGGPTAEIYAGMNLTSCTAGFTVRSGGNVTGITTAAHCANAQSFNGTSLPYQGSKSNTTDVQWHTTPNLTDAGKIKLGPTTYRLVTGHLAYTDVYNGMTLCKYGNSTGYDCGEVTSIGYLPVWISPSSPYFGRLTNCSTDMSTGGDSGGPIFHNGSAVGLTSGYDSINIFCEDENIFAFLYPFATNALDIGVILGG